MENSVTKILLYFKLMKPGNVKESFHYIFQYAPERLIAYDKRK